MGKKDKHDGTDKENELQQIEGWLDELPDFDKKESPVATYEDILGLIERMKGDNKHIDNAMIIGKVSEALALEADVEKMNALFALLKDHNADCSDYSMLGMSAYEIKNFTVAERAYRYAVELCSEEYLMTGYKNNLAYLIRRNEIGNPEKRSKKEVPILLRDGVAKKDTFSLINMALFWVLENGSEENWDLADKLISYVNKNDVMGAIEWWKGVALADETEGYLVHLLLLRHGKIGSSSLGSIEVLFDRIKKDYPGIPDKMKEIVTPFDGGEFDKFPTFPPVDWD